MQGVHTWKESAQQYTTDEADLNARECYPSHNMWTNVNQMRNTMGCIRTHNRKRDEAANEWEWEWKNSQLHENVKTRKPRYESLSDIDLILWCFPITRIHTPIPPWNYPSKPNITPTTPNYPPTQYIPPPTYLPPTRPLPTHHQADLTLGSEQYQKR